jgi:hypothetical protein
MAIMDGNTDQELIKIWQLVSDLSNQINESRNTAATLRQQAEVLKVSSHLLRYCCEL